MIPRDILSNESMDNAEVVDYEDIALEAEVDAIISNTIDPKTRATYIAKGARIIIWLCENDPQYVNNELMVLLHQNFGEYTTAEDTPERIKEEEQKRKDIFKYVKEHLAKAPFCPPLAFDIFPSRVFIKFLCTLRMGNGKKPGIETSRHEKSTLTDKGRE